MTTTHQRILAPAAGVPCAEIGSFLSQMDDQSRRLTEDTRRLSSAALAWQPAPGTNTIGMLLAHIAIVEVFWFSLAAGIAPDCPAVLGIGEDDDGMPLAETGLPPAALAQRELAFFDDLLSRARAFSYRRAREWTAADLERLVRRTRQDGSEWTFNVSWILYHVLEHEAGHYGQINLLAHLHRASHASPGGPPEARFAARGGLE